MTKKHSGFEVSTLVCVCFLPRRHFCCKPLLFAALDENTCFAQDLQNEAVPAHTSPALTANFKALSVQQHTMSLSCFATLHVSCVVCCDVGCSSGGYPTVFSTARSLRREHEAERRPDTVSAASALVLTAQGCAVGSSWFWRAGAAMARGLQRRTRPSS